MEAESSEEVKTHGGEEIDAFINAFLRGETHYEEEDLTLGEGWVLQEDMVVNNLVLEEGKLDLKGQLEKGSIVIINAAAIPWRSFPFVFHASLKIFFLLFIIIFPHKYFCLLGLFLLFIIKKPFWHSFA